MYEHLTTEEIIAGMAAGEISYDELSPEQFDAFMDWEPPMLPMTSFDLSSDEQRRQFLYQYQWKGDELLFPAVSHIWDSLDGQREAHCILVGLLSGTGGKGKTALRLTLQQFLKECLDGPDLIPSSSAFGSIEEWNEAVHQQWSGEEERVLELCARYSAILDGRPPPTDIAHSAASATRFSGNK